MHDSPLPGPDAHHADVAEDAPAPFAPTRRRVLGLAVTAGAGSAVLAACGGSSTASTTTTKTAAAAGSSTPAASASASGGGSLVAVADVPVGGGVVIASPAVVVTQPTAGTFKGFSSICTHLNCPVARVKAGLIECDCHGSRYNAADGTVKSGPATRPLKEIAVAVKGDQVVEA